MDRYSLILCKKILGPKSPKVTYVKKPLYFMGISMASPLFSVVVVCHLDMRQLILGGPDEFIFCVDSKKIFINQIATKIKNIGNDYAEQGVLRARIYTGNGLFIPINVPHDFVRKNDATWKERERGWRFYKIIPYHVSEEYKDAYEVSLSMLIDSIEETGFYEIQKL